MSNSSQKYVVSAECHPRSYIDAWSPEEAARSYFADILKTKRFTCSLNIRVAKVTEEQEFVIRLDVETVEDGP